MLLPHRKDSIILGFTIVVSLVMHSAARSDEGQPSEDFKKGLRVGRGLAARERAGFCLQLLSKIGDDENHSKLEPEDDPRGIIWAHLLSSAYEIHATLDAFPEEKRKRSVEYLKAISDYVHETVPSMMVDESTYKTDREAMTKRMRDLKMSDERIEFYLGVAKEDYDTIQILKKYRSAITKENKSK